MPTPAPEAPLAGHHDTLFPFDEADVVQTAIRNAHKEVTFVLQGIEALGRLYGVELGQPPSPDQDQVKQDFERAADERMRELGQPGGWAGESFAESIPVPKGKSWKQR